ncbi:uncharacterized protein Z519_07795 [Cladophialophora bantiana CBS 173.52]|uniref:Uncharacterized protein n=1 Tax=Cladophialophora bantiana (strain ATCC 10958 / CBS 173.52 / CDC B-1940 / NIH 8579) TaxID=1442370 RepID=A0A0D2HLZ9_CLAB1|nr:uncharacterized protein Z519_07795 [Cladophialophora bantiana CBS 173.52]KIW91825.1 hypothetical protein Z519_07795 [Cladophialophora bantiana CBS 173.52]
MDVTGGTISHIDTSAHSSFGQSNAASSSAEETAGLRSLAIQAEALSSSLNKLRLHCGHESTSLDIANATEELKLLMGELNSLDSAVKVNKELYTEAFGEDLGEIRAHLGGIFEDIADCCKEMQKADGPNTSAVGWLTKKRYVRKLQKHLEVNKTTLIVMRTVLHHGKEYGTHNSPGRLAESSPHTLQEDLAILETVFASRNAIKDLQSLAKKPHDHSSSTSSTGTSDTMPSFQPGAHGRNLSSATGVDVPAMGDVLPARIADGKTKKQDALARRFSRRGVRLAVHSSIMDTNAHDVPISLRKKWIHQVQLRHDPDHADAGIQSIAQLSKISEVNSSPGPDEEPAKSISLTSLTTPEHMKGRESGRASSAASSTSGLSNAPRRSSSLINSPLGRKLGNIIARLSRGSTDQRGIVDGECAESREQVDQHENESSKQADKEKKEATVVKKDMSAKEKPGWSYRLTRPFVKPELTTPDFERGF